MRNLRKDYKYALVVPTSMGLRLCPPDGQPVGVGDVMQKNLEALGHITVNFSGNAEAGLPGSMVEEKAEVPKLKVGSVISVIA